MIVITVARKPIAEGTVAANVLTHGTGAINIDGCRISAPTETITNHARSSDAAVSKGKYGDSKAQETHQTSGQALGRWPANLILQHAEGCQEVGSKTVTGDGHWPATRGTGSKVSGPSGHKGQEDLEERHATETLAVWDCVDGCPVHIMDSTNKVTTSCQSSQAHPGYSGEGATGFLRGVSNPSNQYADTGGPSRFFKQFGAGQKK